MVEYVLDKDVVQVQFLEESCLFNFKNKPF
jgi:hypothetical protein